MVAAKYKLTDGEHKGLAIITIRRLGCTIWEHCFWFRTPLNSRNMINTIEGLKLLKWSISALEAPTLYFRNPTHGYNYTFLHIFVTLFYESDKHKFPLSFLLVDNYKFQNYQPLTGRTAQNKTEFIKIL